MNKNREDRLEDQEIKQEIEKQAQKLTPTGQGTACPGSERCAGCYEVKPGIFIHPQKWKNRQ